MERGLLYLWSSRTYVRGIAENDLKCAFAESNGSHAMATLLRSAVLNPEGYRTVRAAGGDAPSKLPSFSSLAPRLDSLNGKTIYLVDTGFGGSGKFLDQVQAWFAEHM